MRKGREDEEEGGRKEGDEKMSEEGVHEVVMLAIRPPSWGTGRREGGRR